MSNDPPIPAGPVAVVDQPLPAVPPSCGACAFGIEVHMPGELAVRIRCHAGPAVAIPSLVGGKPAVQYARPIWRKEEWCFMFAPKPKTGAP